MFGLTLEYGIKRNFDQVTLFVLDNGALEDIDTISISGKIHVDSTYSKIYYINDGNFVNIEALEQRSQSG